MRVRDYLRAGMGMFIVCFWGFINYKVLTMNPPPAVDGEIVGRILGMIDAATLAVIYYMYGPRQAQRPNSAQRGPNV